MTLTRVTRFATLAGIAALAAACQDSQPAASRTDVPQQGVATDGASLSRAIPGFGGLFLDERGTPTVYLTDLGERDRAEVVLNDYAKSHGDRLNVLEGRYGWMQLAQAQKQASEVLALDGVVFTDLDEAENSVTVGVDGPAGLLAAQRFMNQSGLPREMVKFEVVEPVHFAVGLRDVVRPVQGGLQINFGNYVCTLGFNAGHAAGASYITNSHCTNTQGGTEGTIHYQALASVAGSRIGTEAADPLYVKGGTCPKGKKCRVSDSSRGQYDVGVTNLVGRIARPASRNALVGTLTIDATNPFFSITGEQGSAVVGEEVNKVGRTTGWTFGKVTRTCVDTGVSGSQVLLYCQNWVNAGVQGGDSGSAVFTWGGSNNVTLKGILWGGTSSNDTFIYSPINAIEQDLGALTTS
jgi:hypothetical protein